MPAWRDVDPSAIAFLYLACAGMADGRLVEAELVRIVERIAQWMPGASRDDVHDVLERATTLLRDAPDDAALAELVNVTAERLHEVLAVEERERLVTELIGLVEADGELDLGETHFVMATARALGVAVAIDDGQ